MLELHGWLTISETYKDEDKYTNETLEDIMRPVNRIIENSGTQLTLQYMNGTPFLTTLLYANHRTKETDTIIETYKSIAKTATGSYGIIYLHDDEDTKHYNEFQLFIFKKGECIYKTDDVFSPCIPTIEDDIYGLYLFYNEEEQLWAIVYGLTVTTLKSRSVCLTEERTLSLMYY